MLRPILIFTVVSACAVAAACTSTQPRRNAVADATHSRLCIRDTGSRIPPAPGSCLNGPGRSISSTDIESTGKTQVGDALPLLDPSITVHR